MKTKSLVKLSIIVILVAIFSYWAFQGFTIHLTRFKPWHENVRQGLDIKGGVVALYQAQPKEGVDFEEGLNQIVSIIQSRLYTKGYTEAVITKQGTDRIRVEIPDVESPDEIFDLIGKAGKLEFKDADGKVLVTGENLKTAFYAGIVEGSPTVSLKFDDKGTQLFAEATKNNVDKAITIYLDGEAKSSPVVNEPITNGEAAITSSSVEDAKFIANVLQSGTMPLALKELSANTVSATLGVGALQGALKAAVIGAILVMLFMLVIYRFFGFVADLALYIYILIFYLFVATFPWLQLTLPAIAGIILSVGMAVDANVVIFERIKDEFREGKSLDAAINTGYSKALTAIIDSNVTTIIAAIIMLLPFSPAPIKNFAITLLAGIVISMFTAIVVTRGLLKLFIKIGVTSPKVLGLKGAKE